MINQMNNFGFELFVYNRSSCAKYFFGPQNASRTIFEKVTQSVTPSASKVSTISFRCFDCFTGKQDTSQEWYLKNGWLEKVDTRSLSPWLEKKMAEPSWLRSFFDLYHHPQCQGLYPQASPAALTRFLLDQGKDIIFERLLLPFLTGAWLYLDQDEYYEVWDTVHKVRPHLYLKFSTADKVYQQEERGALFAAYCHEQDEEKVDQIAKEIVQEFGYIGLHHIAQKKEYHEPLLHSLARQNWCTEKITRLSYTVDPPLVTAPMLELFVNNLPFFSTYLAMRKKEFLLDYSLPLSFDRAINNDIENYLKILLEFLKCPKLEPLALKQWSEIKDYSIFYYREDEVEKKHKFSATSIAWLLEHECGASQKDIAHYIETYNNSIDTEAIIYLAKHKRPIGDWLKAHQIIEIWNQRVPGFKHLLKDQLFSEILGRYQNPLLDNPEVVSHFDQAVSLIGINKNKCALFFNALQNGHTLLEVATCLEDEVYFAEIKKATFFTKDFTMQCKLLTRIIVTRKRDGLAICKSIVKRFVSNIEKNSSERKLVSLALRGLSQFALEPSESTFSNLLFCFEYDHDEVTVSALKALIRCGARAKEPKVKEALFKILQTSSNRIKTEILYSFGHFNLDKGCQISNKIIQLLIALSKDQDQEVRIASAFALATIEDVSALKACCQVVMSKDWNRFNSYYLQDRQNHLGGHSEGLHRLFIGMPAFMKSRSAMISQVLDQLIVLQDDSLLDAARTLYKAWIYVDEDNKQRQKPKQADIDHALHLLDLSPKDKLEIKKIACPYSIIGAAHNRYVPLPFHYPQNVSVYRVISNRKGDTLFLNAVLDLLQYGQQPLDLDLLGSSYDSASWAKQGIAFASHDAQDIVREYGGEGATSWAMMEIDRDFVNQALRKRQARWEIEENYNVALMHGIPREAIVKIYLPKEKEIEFSSILNPDVPLTQVQSSYSPTQIMQLRKRVARCPSLRSKILFIDKPQWKTSDAADTTPATSLSFTQKGNDERYNHIEVEMLARAILRYALTRSRTDLFLLLPHEFLRVSNCKKLSHSFDHCYAQLFSDNSLVEKELPALHNFLVEHAHEARRALKKLKYTHPVLILASMLTPCINHFSRATVERLLEITAPIHLFTKQERLFVIDALFDVDFRVREMSAKKNSEFDPSNNKLQKLIHAPRLTLEELQECIDELPYPFVDLSKYKAGHGTKEDGNPVTLLEHTEEVIGGFYGGFGLQSGFSIRSMSAVDCRKLLYIAALFHDIGKCITFKEKHIEYSAKIAQAHLSNYENRWGLSSKEVAIIVALIRYNDLFGRYFQDMINITQLADSLNVAHRGVSKWILRLDEFTKLLFRLWIADASTLRVVNTDHRDVYLNLLKDIDTLDFAVLEQAKNQILSKASD